MPRANTILKSQRLSIRAFFVFITCTCVMGFLLIEPALANKFQTIGGGVTGGNAKKLAVLKEIALYAGSFFIFLGAMALLTRNRFEGMIGMRSSKKGLGTVIIVPIVLMLFGSTLILFHIL